MTRRRRGLRASVLMLTLLCLLVTVPALAQPDQDETGEPPLQVDARGRSFSPDGRTELVVNVSGPAAPGQLDPSAFTVYEGERAMTDLDVVAVADGVGGDAPRVVTALSVDVSGSMEGQPLEDVQAAATDMVESLTGFGVEVGIHTWAVEWDRLSAPTTDLGVLTNAIGSFEVSDVPELRFTALFDAVIRDIAELETVGGDAIRSLILFADGGDNRSDASMEDAIEAAQDAGIPVTVIAYETEGFEPSLLEPIAEQTGGEFFIAEQTADGGTEAIADVFADVTADVASQYVVSYESDVFEQGTLTITIEVETGQASADTTFILDNPRDVTAIAPPPPPAAAPAFDPGPFGTPVALFGALGVAFVAVLLLLMTVLVPRGNPAVARTLRRGLTMVTRAPQDAPRTSGLSASAIGRRAMEMVDAVPVPAGYDERLQNRIDRAGWQLRASEFNALRIAVAAAAGAWMWALTGRALLGLTGFVAGAVGPTLVLVNAEQRRQARFMELLPDTLQLLSGTLRAGYGALQAIDTVVKESEAPMSTEFQRVLTEVRLGLPLEDSLGAMADRVDNDDFRWVVVAMNIQRRVGGNLAELLETVANTLREREQVRRQVKVLSAEGRLSAVVLIALPFVILTYLLFVNPTYLLPLFREPLGLSLVGGSVVLLALGVLWMRRLIRIDV